MKKFFSMILVAVMVICMIPVCKVDAKSENTIEAGKEWTTREINGREIDQVIYKVPSTGFSYVEIKPMRKYVKGELKEGSTITIRKVEIFDSGKTYQTIHYLKNNNEEQQTSKLLAVPKGKKITISVENDNSINTKIIYKIRVIHKASKVCEKESNDKFSKATIIKQKKTYSGIINSSSDTDYFKFVAPKDGKYNFYIEKWTGEKLSQHPVVIKMYDRKKREVRRNNNIFGLSWKAVAKEKVYLKKGQAMYLRIEHSSGWCLPYADGYKIKVK